MYSFTVRAACNLCWIQFALLSGFLTHIGGFRNGCIPVNLPHDVRVSQNGPILKVYCPAGLRPLEVDPDGVIIASRVRFARYICSDGAYKRVDPNGINAARYFCADEQASKCPVLELTTDNLTLTHHHVVARIGCKQTKRFVILYCTHGIWHSLDAVDLPSGLRLVPKNSTILKQNDKRYFSHLGTNATEESTRVSSKPPDQWQNTSGLVGSLAVGQNLTPDPKMFFQMFLRTYYRTLSTETRDVQIYYTTTISPTDKSFFRLDPTWILDNSIPFISIVTVIMLSVLIVFILLYKKYMKSVSTARFQLNCDLNEKSFPSNV